MPRELYRTSCCEICGGELQVVFLPKGTRLLEDELEFCLKEKEITQIECNDYFLLKELKKEKRQLRRAVLTKEGYKSSVPSCSNCSHVPLLGCRCEECSIALLENRAKALKAASKELDSEANKEFKSIHQQVAYLHFLVQEVDPMNRTVWC